MTINGVVITAETIQKTRQWFADNAQDCILGANRGEFYVNDLGKFTDWQNRCIAESLSGAWDHNLTFVQRALFIQTGQSIPMLS
jgi:hypothetical protein